MVDDGGGADASAAVDVDDGPAWVDVGADFSNCCCRGPRCDLALPAHLEDLPLPAAASAEVPLAFSFPLAVAVSEAFSFLLLVAFFGDSSD